MCNNNFSKFQVFKKINIKILIKNSQLTSYQIKFKKILEKQVNKWLKLMKKLILLNF